jgi:hypothetical protein
LVEHSTSFLRKEKRKEINLETLHVSKYLYSPLHLKVVLLDIEFEVRSGFPHKFKGFAPVSFRFHVELF